MKRALCVGALLLLWGSWQARAGSHGAAFVCKQCDGGRLCFFQPVIVPQIAVVQVKGPKEVNKGEVLVCTQRTERHEATDAEGPLTVSTGILVCGDREFEVKGVRFEEE